MKFVLFKYNGRFDAGLRSSGMPFAVALAGVPSLLRVVGLFCLALIAPLMVLGAIALMLHGHAHSAIALATAPVATTGTEFKKVIDELKTEWEGFKSRHEQEVAEQKKIGDVTAETKAALEKNNAALDAIELKFNRMRTAAGLQKIDDEILEERAQRSAEQRSFLKWARRGPNRL